MIENLVLSGGATKGLVYIGIFKAFDELNIRKNIKRVIGTSIGGLMGLLFVLGLSGKQIEELFIKLDSNKLKDIKVENIVEMWTSKGHGIDSGNRLEEVCRIILNKITGNDRITMKELWEKTGIEWSVISVNLNQNKWVEISYKTFPNLEIYKAIRMTTAIPIYYNCVEYEGESYVDGAIMLNYPIELMKDSLENTLGIV
jgi:NTE family protein